MLGALVALGGCGGGASTDADPPATTAAAATPATAAPCRVGESVLPHVPEAPTGWTSGPGPTLALACSSDGVDRGNALVGYAIPGGGSCLAAYSLHVGEAVDELCELPGSPWTVQCDGRGCVHYFSHDPSWTMVDGPADGAAEGVRVLVDGKPLREGVLFAAVHGRLMHAIRAEEPFGFFAVQIPRCVDPNQVKVVLLGADGRRLGEADQWDVGVQSCRAMS